MSPQSQSHSDNDHYQRQLAKTLIAHLGVEGAAHACQANCWDGVLIYVLQAREDRAPR